MPTKHKRKRGEDKSQFDLPPTTKARSLPVIEPTKDFLAPRKKARVDGGGKRPKRNADDTPKVFARLMAWHNEGKKLPSGLDNGDSQRRKKKQKNVAAAEKEEEEDGDGGDGLGGGAQGQGQGKGKEKGRLSSADAEGTPKIRPGESLAEFAVRVDQALPLSALPKSNTNPNAHLPEDLRAKSTQKLTKHNKRLARVQSEWRRVEAKLRAKEEEEAEENEEKMAEEKLLWDGVKLGKKRKKGAKAIDDDDPWKELERKRLDSKQKNVRDVVEAPPVLPGIKNMFKEKAERQLAMPLVSSSKDRNGKKVRSRDEIAEVRRTAILEAERRRASSGSRVAV